MNLTNLIDENLSGSILPRLSRFAIGFVTPLGIETPRAQRTLSRGKGSGST